MSSRHGPLELDCDAPPYGIVAACARLGFRTPLDVRWTRLRHHRERQARPAHESTLAVWKSLFGQHPTSPDRCVCGECLPPLERCRFQLASTKEVDYLLVQCRRCRTIFWENG